MTILRNPALPEAGGAGGARPAAALRALFF